MRLRNAGLVTAIALLAGCSGATNSLGAIPQSAAVGTPSSPANVQTSLQAMAQSAFRLPSPVSSRRGLESLNTGAFGMSAFAANVPAMPLVGAAPTSAAAPVCDQEKKDDRKASCPVKIASYAGISAAATPATSLAGLLPGQIQSIYNLSGIDTTSGNGRTVAVVIAYDDPQAEADLQVYRNEFNMPACKSANGCFKKIAQDGSQRYPSADAAWSIETSTDLDTVSAVCPGCNIMLVEANSSDITDLALAVDRAVASGATVVSNSYGVPEAADNVQMDAHYNHPGVPIVVAAGDAGFGATFPASSEYVISVGGTTLYDSSGGISEVAWSHTNSGCSAFIAKPSWQKDKGCAHRAMNDIAIVADPATGMAIYDSTLDGTSGGWTVSGGTSISAPIIASLVAMTSEPTAYSTAAIFYKQKDKLLNITSGANGNCSPAYLCTAGKGYNGPTGNGVPNKADGFK